MKTINGYQEIVLPDGSKRLIWVGGPHREGFFSNGHIDINGFDPGALGPLPGMGGISLEKQGSSSIFELFEKYWPFLAIGLTLIILLKRK